MAGQDLRSRFRDVVTSEDELRAVLGPTQQRALDKVVHTLDGQSRAFIARSPFLFLATRRADGRIDVTPRSDPPGFVRVLNQTTLAIPDRPGPLPSFAEMLKAHTQMPAPVADIQVMIDTASRETLY